MNFITQKHLHRRTVLKGAGVAISCCRSSVCSSCGMSSGKQSGKQLSVTAKWFAASVFPELASKRAIAKALAST